MTEKKNPDYSGSAVMLTNPPQVMIDLQAIRGLNNQMAELQEKVKLCIPQEIKDEIAKVQAKLDEASGIIRADIETYGSYQDIDKGEYALKQKRESIIYKPELVRQYAPSKVASFVLIESVDTKALDALVKAGQLTPVEARQCGEVKESFAYIIK